MFSNADKVKWIIQTCPKCGSKRMYLDVDNTGSYYKCLPCGYEKPVFIPTKKDFSMLARNLSGKHGSTLPMD